MYACDFFFLYTGREGEPTHPLVDVASPRVVTGDAASPRSTPFLGFVEKTRNRGEVRYNVTAFGEVYQFVLRPERRFIAPSFTVEHFSGNQSISVPCGSDLSHCYYRGHVLDDPVSSAVFDLCNGMVSSISCCFSFCFFRLCFFFKQAFTRCFWIWSRADAGVGLLRVGRTDGEVAHIWLQTFNCLHYCSVTVGTPCPHFRNKWIADIPRLSHCSEEPFLRPKVNASVYGSTIGGQRYYRKHTLWDFLPLLRDVGENCVLRGKWSIFVVKVRWGELECRKDVYLEMCTF